MTDHKLDLGTRQPRQRAQLRVTLPEETPASLDHDQWLLDEALGETFPASDPISPASSSRQRR